MPKGPPERKAFREERRPDERLERFLRRLEPTMLRAEMEGEARAIARNDLLPSFFKWSRKLMTEEIRRRARYEMQALDKLTMPIRAVSLFERKQELVGAIAKRFEIFYERRKTWPPNLRLALLKEMMRGLLESKQELREQKTVSLNEKLDELGKWKRRGLKIDESIEESFLEEADRAIAETQKAVVNSLLPSINRKIAEVQKEMRQG